MNKKCFRYCLLTQCLCRRVYSANVTLHVYHIVAVVAFFGSVFFFCTLPKVYCTFVVCMCVACLYLENGKIVHSYHHEWENAATGS